MNVSPKIVNRSLDVVWPCRVLLAGLALSVLQSSILAAGVDYQADIKPLLRMRCFSCHGALKQEADLRLDTVAAMLAGGDSGPVVVANDATASLILARITAADPDLRMPPEHEAEQFTDAQVRLLHEWITAGAIAPENEQPELDPHEHWAFRPITRPAVPEVSDARWNTNPIDAFIAERHESAGVRPQPSASRQQLLRRLTFDLIGLPPTPEQVALLSGDLPEDWYQQTVEELLANPQHGERWARHWMDIWRYSDWWGLGKQLRRSQKHIWHWRDWMIESLNDDVSYAEMVRLMLSADEQHPNDLAKLRATGYLARNYWLFNRTQWMDETVEHVSKGMLGLTVNCAKCHDHKYDPIEQTDFYRMRAIFEPYHVRLDVVPGQPDLARDGIPRVYDGAIDLPTYLFVRGEEKNPDKSTAIAPGVPAFMASDEFAVEAVTLPVDAWQPERRAWVIESHLFAAQENLQKSNETVSAATKKLANAKVATPEMNANVPEVQQQLKVAEAEVDVAAANVKSISQRADAMRESWAVADDETAEEIVREKAVAAIQAERELAAVTARHALAVAELELLRAAEGKKAAAEKNVQAAGEALKKAETAVAAAIKDGDQFTQLEGAKWTPTRFFFSGKDDPEIKFPPQSTGRRTALARWITDHRNPLTARVAVNHLWTRHMGTPLVPTIFDFGRNGEPPTHPELLDWLAAELMDNNWSMKHLHREIVNSETYRMSSSGSNRVANVEKDPDNHAWWRRVPMRLESQVLRDSLLAHAGTLDPTLGGPTVPNAKQDASTRRSLYFFHSNNDRNLFLTTFDEALVTECYRREQSVVPQQALAMTNSKLVHGCAAQIAQRLSEGPKNDTEFIQRLFLVLLGISADADEVAACTKALEQWRAVKDGSDEAAHSNLVWSLINHNDFVTLR
jgi:hypothetical protein